MAVLLEKVFGQFTHGTIAAVAAQDEVGLTAQAPGPMGRAHEQPYGGAHGEVVEVIADEGRVLGLEQERRGG